MEAPGDFSTCTNTLPTSPWTQVCYCRDGSCVADSTKHLILQERRAESLLLEKKKGKRNLATLSWSEGEQGSITSTRIHRWPRIQIPTYNATPEVLETHHCLQAFWRQVGFLDKWFCCFQWLHHKEGWPLGLGGLLAAVQSLSPIFPGSITSPSTIISSRAQHSSHRSM